MTTIYAELYQAKNAAPDLFLHSCWDSGVRDVTLNLTSSVTHIRNTVQVLGTTFKFKIQVYKT